MALACACGQTVSHKTLLRTQFVSSAWGSPPTPVRLSAARSSTRSRRVAAAAAAAQETTPVTSIRRRSVSLFGEAPHPCDSMARSCSSAWRWLVVPAAALYVVTSSPPTHHHHHTCSSILFAMRQASASYLQPLSLSNSPHPCPHAPHPPTNHTPSNSMDLHQSS
jgi:hypothetical protein